jgi:hypothetical protein
MNLMTLVYILLALLFFPSFHILSLLCINEMVTYFYT